MSWYDNPPHNDSAESPGDFDDLTPQAVLRSVEAGFDLRLSGSITPYNSYINRVYELTDEDGQSFMAKFYRPGRWDEAAILEEHRFIQDCVALEIPTVAPLPDADGDTLITVELEGVVSGLTKEYSFAVFPKRSGRNFDAESEDDWLRLGSLVGRMHTAARQRPASHRLVCNPATIRRTFLQELEAANAVPGPHHAEFFELAHELLERIEPLFKDIPLQRVHGDCHRGNILERPGEGLLLIDFDDMMMGPAVQDLWLLLPERADNCPAEFNLIVEGYEQFQPFDYRWKGLIEPLRAMRMLYYLAWAARQRNDLRFRREHPDWGTPAFWIKEIEDLREQLPYCE
ncbi:serine/threonine protein kinase [Spirochaeta africana]|uniref:Stress response kinase A n=1 Tax=Spirochaeta africana (strain ATCC 700263 / DSM 8902 / Z-7692) TaxID=889378 RepID=H9UJW3_SPIAZ|nr:serine/threonine protein kinase [Spirochaeta africana]AFG37806.1 putative homoserine kinase type II (protein kinase fold) [Spirochaeta africana DSM 8902]